MRAGRTRRRGPRGAHFIGRQPPLDLTHYRVRCCAADAAPSYRFSHARTALKFGLRALGMGPDARILIPELICDSLIEPLDALGIGADYFAVTRALTPDWDDVSRKLAASTRALCMVHYFGQPQDVHAFRRFCDDHGLLLVEDNAHGFGGTIAGAPLGSFGDIGISSPRKTFPVLNGAYLHARRELPARALDLELEPLRYRRARLKSNCRRWLDGLPRLRRLVRGRPAHASQEAYRDAPLAGDWCMDAATAALIEGEDLEAVGATRRALYRVWQRWTESTDLEPVFPALAPGAAPMVFPARAPSPRSAGRWFEWGYRNAVDVHSWPTLPRALVDADGSAMAHWRHLVCFPIHQAICEHALAERLRAAPPA